MNLRRRKRKTAQALDAVAGVTKIWTEWQVGKKAGKGVAKAGKGVAKVKKAGLPSRVRKLLSSKPARLAGIGAIVGGAGAAVAKKLKGGGPEPIYTPPPPGEPVAPPDVAPPLAIAPEPTTPTDAKSPQGTRESAIGEAGLRGGGDEAAAEADVDVDAVTVEPAGEEPAPAPAAVEDLATSTPERLDETASAAGTITLGDDAADDDAGAEPVDAPSGDADDETDEAPPEASGEDAAADDGSDDDDEIIRRR